MIVKLKKNKSSKNFSNLNLKLYLPIFAFVVLASAFADKPLALAVFNLKNPLQDFFLFINQICAPGLSVLLFPLLFFYIRFFTRKEKLSRPWWLFSLAIPISLFCCGFLGFLLGKSSPEWLLIHGEITFRPLRGFLSFPSAISCNLGAIAACIACLYPKRRTLALVLGISLGFAQALIPTCFLSDALAGLGIGLLVSFLIFRTMRREVLF